MKVNQILAAGFLFSVTLLSSLSAQTPLAARIQRLEDIEAIRTVLLNYGRFLDARDLPAYSRLFAKDGEWVGGFGSAKGPADERNAKRRLRSNHLSLSDSRRRGCGHLLGPFTVRNRPPRVGRMFDVLGGASLPLFLVWRLPWHRSG